MIRFVEAVPDKLEQGQIWRVGLFAQTARVGNETQKSYAGLGGSEDRAMEALDAWKSLGWKGNPASAHTFFRKMFEDMKRRGDVRPRMNASINYFLRQGFYGGWIEVMQPGFCDGPIYHYDLNKAYYWAGSVGLPLSVRGYEKGDKNFLVLARIKSHRRELPVMIEGRKHKVLLSNADIDTYGIDPEILGGVSWATDTDRFYPESVFAELAGRVPDWIFRKAMSTYWGMFAQSEPIFREIWKGGKLQKTIKMHNRNKNIFWAQSLISRVCRHVYDEAVRDARQVYVDSMLVPREIQTGVDIGQWKLVNEFPQGVIIKDPGCWTAYPDGRKLEYNQWHKHSGYSDIH